MNKQISRIAVFTLLLLASLIVATTYWQTWAAPGLAAKQDNAIQRVAQFTIDRGLIYASDGRTVLAANRAAKIGGRTRYVRKYPAKELAAHGVGDSTQARSRSGLERSENAYLTAANASLGTIWSKVGAQLTGKTIKGNNLVLNLRTDAQQVAISALRGKCGAAFVMNPRTGQVYVSASSPSFDPNRIEAGNGYAAILHSPSACPGSSGPLLNRATSGLFPPGSTFKTVTAAAALESGVYSAQSRFNDRGYCVEYGQPVSNALNPDQTAERYGDVSFLEAYEHSINAVFCDIGKALGAKRVLDQAKRFGFYAKPPLEIPSGEVAASGLYHLSSGLYDNPSIVDPGRLAFGQEHLLATPLQMTLVAAAVANGGVIMQPHLVNRITSPSGATVVAVRPRPWRRAVSPKTAAVLSSFLQAVVTGGTGAAAALPGIRVAGKTGTAETNQKGVYTAWFIFFAPADRPQVAGAVVVEHQLHGFGGAVAAPIARQLIRVLLSRH